MRELSSAPEGHLFELLVLPGAERRGNQGFAAQLAHSPRSEAEGGTRTLTGRARATRGLGPVQRVVRPETAIARHYRRPMPALRFLHDTLDHNRPPLAEIPDVVLELVSCRLAH
jgi:hypothetical protein